jgi:hypothetical protein
LKQLSRVYKNWYSVPITLVTAFFYLYLVIGIQTIGNSATILFSTKTSTQSKADVIISPVLAMGSFFHFTINSILTVTVAILLGVLLTIVLYIKFFGAKEIAMNTVCKISKDTKATGGISAVIAFLGVGCVPCHTAVLSPLVALLVTGGSVFVTNVIQNAILAIAVILTVYAIITMLNQLTEIFSKH